MSNKGNITVGPTEPWDKYANPDLHAALKCMFDDAWNFSKIARDWYWSSITAKRRTSLWIRGVTFLFVVCGALLPLLAALVPGDSHRLLATQSGVAALVLAGLMQAADRVFGWSSGWLRYISTVTAMETVTRQFVLDWESYIVGKGSSLADIDRKPLLDLADQMMRDIAKLQAEETEKWVVEFNSSLASLSDLIRSQRESADKMLDLARRAIEVQRLQQTARDSRLRSGAIELSLAHAAAPKLLTISLDGESAETFLGTAWSRRDVEPGLHTLTITAVEGAHPQIMVAAEVVAAAITRLSIAAP